MCRDIGAQKERRAKLKVFLPFRKREIFVADLTLTDNIGGSGEPNGFDCTAVPADGHTQFSAGDGDGNILAADLPQKSEGQDCGTGAGAAGVSEILYPPFIGQFRKAIRSGDVIKVDVGAFRESGVRSEERRVGKEC